MTSTRKAWLLGTAGAVVGGAGVLSIPGGGPRTYFGGQPPATNFAPPNAIFSVDGLRSELAWLVDTLREVGAEPFAFTSESAFDIAYHDALEQLNRPLDARGFFLIVAPLFATLRDGHVSIYLGRDYDKWRERGGRAFPLELKFTQDGMYVDVPTHDALAVGTRIDAIGGVEGRRFMERVARLQGAQTPLLRLTLGAVHVREYLYAAYGERETFAIRATLPDGSQFHGFIPATTSEQLERALRAGADTKEANYSFARIAGGKVGYIDYRHCVDFPAFKSFLKQTFGSVAASPVKGLIIDIRRNGGGDSDLNAELWSYVAPKPFRLNATWAMKVSSRLKHEYGFFRYNIMYLPPAWLMRNGSIYSIDISRFASVRPKPDSIRYAGPVYLLIGVATFSSALDCAEIAKDNTLATIIGQETGEPADTTGQVYQGYSPRIGVRFQFTTKYFWDPKIPRGRGVIPDVTIVPDDADLRANRDPVLDYAVARIILNQG